MFYLLSRFILMVLLRVFFGLKIIGRQNLPRKGPYIAACNHSSYLDPPILGAGIPAKARFLARENLFRKGVMGWWMRSVDCIPVKRGKRDIRAMRETLRYLSKGGIVPMFPEGTRSIDGSLKEAKRGMGFLAYKAGVPIIPAYIKGTKDALRKHSRSVRFKPVTIYFGERIEPDYFDKISNRENLYEEISRKVMEKIAQLKEEHGD